MYKNNVLTKSRNIKTTSKIRVFDVFTQPLGSYDIPMNLNYVLFKTRLHLDVIIVQNSKNI